MTIERQDLSQLFTERHYTVSRMTHTVRPESQLPTLLTVDEGVASNDAQSYLRNGRTEPGAGCDPHPSPGTLARRGLATLARPEVRAIAEGVIALDEPRCELCEYRHLLFRFTAAVLQQMALTVSPQRKPIGRSRVRFLQSERS
jgi:hypothetical protein